MSSKIMMFYRFNEDLRSQSPNHRFSEWQYMLVSDDNSHKTDGETFDLIKHYQDDRDGKWEVFLQDVTLPGDEAQALSTFDRSGGHYAVYMHNVEMARFAPSTFWSCYADTHKNVPGWTYRWVPTDND